MKKLFFLVSLVTMVYATTFAQTQTDPYVVNLQDAVWNFDDYSNAKGVIAGNENFVCPNSWIVGNAGSSKASAAYLPFIYPSKLDTENSYGYDGRLCERIYGIASSGRVPVYAILPVIDGKNYDNLILTFYGKGEPSLTSKVYYANLRIGYLTDIADTANLKSSFAEKVVNFKDTVLSQEQYDKYEIVLKGIPEGAHVVFYDDDATKINSCLLDNISFVEKKQEPTPTSLTETTTESDARKIYHNGQIMVSRNGRIYTVQGQCVE